MDGSENNERTEIFSKSVRAGKRTYFFDVKSTKGNDFYLTITESKKRFSDDGKFHYEKHKLFLYKEDFEKFTDGLEEAIEKIRSLQSEMPEDDVSESGHYDSDSTSDSGQNESKDTTNDFTSIDFEDLDK
jgi:hypothetical protein